MDVGAALLVCMDSSNSEAQQQRRRRRRRHRHRGDRHRDSVPSPQLIEKEERTIENLLFFGGQTKSVHEI